VVLAVRAEMPTDMDVGIDPPGHHSQPPQVVHPAGSMRIEPNDLAIFNDDSGIVQSVTFAIQKRAHPQHDWLVLRRGNAGRSHYASQNQKNTFHISPSLSQGRFSLTR